MRYHHVDLVAVSLDQVLHTNLSLGTHVVAYLGLQKHDVVMSLDGGHEALGTVHRGGGAGRAENLNHVTLVRIILNHPVGAPLALGLGVGTDGGHIVLARGAVSGAVQKDHGHARGLCSLQGRNQTFLLLGWQQQIVDILRQQVVYIGNLGCGVVLGLVPNHLESGALKCFQHAVGLGDTERVGVVHLRKAHLLALAEILGKSL